MKREELKDFLEALEKEDYIGIASYLKDENLRDLVENKLGIDEFFKKYRRQVIEDICSQVPQELYDYFLTRLIKKCKKDFVDVLVKDEQKRIDIAENEEYDDLLRANLAISISDINKRIELLKTIKSEFAKVLIIKTLPDDLKLKFLNTISSEINIVDVIKNIESDEEKVKILKGRDFWELYRAQIIASIKDVNTKLSLIDSLHDVMNKTIVVKTLPDDLKIELVKKHEFYAYKAEIFLAVEDPDKRKSLIDELVFDEDQEEILCTLPINKRIEYYENNTQYASKVKVLKKLLNADTKDDLIDYLDINDKDNSLGLPKDMTIGIELETEGFFSELIRYKRKLFGKWSTKDDETLDNGLEVVSPILHDTKEDMDSLNIMCNVLKKIGQETTERCGGHIHIGADYINSNPQAMENFLTIWNECEELIYKMANDVGEIPRSNVINFASSNHFELEQFANKGTVEIKNEQDFQKIRSKLMEKDSKFWGLNLGHCGEEGKNTIEFRISNGTIDARVIKENIKLYASLMQVSKEMSLNPEYKKVEFRVLKDRHLTEGEKVEALLNLLFNDEQTKSIYRNRWKSVRDNDIFDKLTLWQEPTFIRGDYRILKKLNFQKTEKSPEEI